MRPIGVLALAILVLNGHGDAAQKEKSDGITVRALKFTTTDPSFALKFGAKGTVTIFKDAPAVEKFVGKKPADVLSEQVDFKKEMIVFVSRGTGGPPEGKLTYEVTGQEKERKLTFYVQSPGPGKRGRRLLVGTDFFAVPRDVTVTFKPGEHR